MLVEEPYLNHILKKQVHKALRQRITVHYNYEGLSNQKVPDHICHKLKLAGGNRSILKGRAFSAIHGYGEGNARKIDNLMTNALTIGTHIVDKRNATYCHVYDCCHIHDIYRLRYPPISFPIPLPRFPAAAPGPVTAFP